jgi:hypothetical protein
VIATAKTVRYIVGDANFKNVFASSTLKTCISRLRIRGSFSPLVELPRSFPSAMLA